MEIKFIIKNALVLYLGVLLFCSCKKETSAPSNSTNTGGNGSIVSSTATSWYGLFSVGRFYDFKQGTTTIYSTSQVSFFKIPQQFPGANCQMVDSVILSGVPMQFWPFQDSSYVDTVGLFSGNPPVISYPYTFKVVGKNVIPSFSYTENGPFPSYTGYSSLPDTIIRNVTLTISLAGISGADNVLISVTTGQKEVSHNLSSPFGNTETFSNSELTQLDTTSNAIIQVILIKNDNKSVYGKPMLFSTGCNYTKHLIVK